MKRSFLVLMTVLLFFGCQWIYDRNKNVTFPEIPHMGFETVREVVRFTADIDYVDDQIHDRDEYWQSPDQTYIWGTGDCEDYVILAMYLVYHELGIEPWLVGGYSGEGWHAWMEADGEWWEPQSGYRCDWYRDRYSHIYRVDYAEVIYRSTHSHRALQE